MRAPPASRLFEALVRLLYVGGGAGAVFLHKRASEIYEVYVRREFAFSPGRWLLVVGAGVLIGMMVGLAVRPWGIRGPYRWDVALVVGLVPIAWFLYQFLWLSLRWEPPTWFVISLFDIMSRYQTVLAVLLGLAIVSGFIARRPEEGVA